VTIKGSIGVVVEVGGKAHPGYYWLAYDHRNILPACPQCNTGGKMCHFPVAGSHATLPPSGIGDLDKLDAHEQPLLLHPYRDDPSKHIRFGEFGVIAAVDGDPRGEASIETYNLRRGDLMDERREAQELARFKFLRLFDSAPTAIFGDPPARGARRSARSRRPSPRPSGGRGRAGSRRSGKDSGAPSR
jgi:hypothetical protein